MPLLDMDPGQSPEAPGVLYFYEQGRDPATGFQVTSGGIITALGVNAVTDITAATAGTDVFSSRVTGDTVARFTIDADGSLRWGSGSGAADCTLSRYTATGLELDCTLRMTNAQLLFGPGGDVNLYWGASNTLKTDDNLTVVGNIATSGTLTGTGASSTAALVGGLVTADTFDRYRVQVGGKTEWGPGNGARDTNLYRSGVGLLATDHSLVLAAAGGGVQVKEGSNATMGLTSAMVAGTVTVSTTKVTANSRVFLTAQNTGGTPGALRISARTPGTSFTITSTSGTDTSTVAWWIVEPAA